MEGFLEDLKGGSASENAEEARRLLDGEGSPAIRDAVCLNAGAALYIYGICESVAEGYEKARTALESGSVKDKLNAVAKQSSHVVDPAGGIR